MKRELTIIGGGPAGHAAAFLAADRGMQVKLIDAEPRLGGVCLNRGCIPSKQLLHLARGIEEVAELSVAGVEFGRPKIDLDTIRRQRFAITENLGNGLAQLAKRRGVERITARATFQDSSTLRLSPVDGIELQETEISFDNCLIATGSSPASVDSLNIASPRVMNSTAALELPELPESLLVVGGGYIGLELGTVYAALGSRVSVVEMTGSLLPGADPMLIRPLARRLAEKFEAIWLNTRVASLREVGEKIEVTFDGDLEEKVQSFDRVLVSVGRVPNSGGLGLEKIGVEVDSNRFVVTDQYGQTSQPKIYAAGDLTGNPMLAHKASHEARRVVENILGDPKPFAPRAIPAVVFTDPEIAWAGLSEPESKAAGKKVATGLFPWAASGRAQAVGRTEGLTKWIIDPETDRVLGCGITGPGAGEMIGEAVVAIENGLTAAQVAEAIHPHPTLSETLGAAAEVYYGTATDVYKPRRNQK
jgi:dihydrolipoyl dehydrogenase